ncbi:hemin uptake protein HemP [Guyparkeria hydrothermalis]|uniref:hemin uptake protein HemP n=1 Tax=Guyparkeria TaxID=2035712 RepID=UPI000F653639|nr:MULTISPECIES: hemin uptake protein HemP [Guyparkeria]MCL7751863.1 hemin uptake protein HemP [Guyparkeria hydrothermalis]RRQ20496.1 hemin uptake protein HemP [Guyparkeria sp. SCN-R1]TKA90009.1 hemin uptake protein HemP [Guyparkeria sp. SB14A]
MSKPSNQDKPKATGAERIGAQGHCIESRELISRDGQCWICHDGQRYQLRVTAANKLILTK